MSGLFWNDYPYTDFHELNLSFLIKKMIELNETVKNFVSLNTIKYADPIQWNIVSQYKKNTVVIDPATGTAYLSVAPVPSGVALTNPDYWTVIFDLDITSSNENITLRNDGNNVLSTFASVVGDWLLWNGTLYRVIMDIAVGQAYVIGYNLERYSVELFVKDYITALSDMIGDLDSLSTTDKSNLVNAINEVVSTVNTLENSVDELEQLVIDTGVGTVYPKNILGVEFWNTSTHLTDYYNFWGGVILNDYAYQFCGTVDSNNDPVGNIIKVDLTTGAVVRSIVQDLNNGNMFATDGNNIFAMRDNTTDFTIYKYDLNLNMIASVNIPIYPCEFLVYNEDTGLLEMIQQDYNNRRFTKITFTTDLTDISSPTVYNVNYALDMHNALEYHDGYYYGLTTNEPVSLFVLDKDFNILKSMDFRTRGYNNGVDLAEIEGLNFDNGKFYVHGNMSQTSNSYQQSTAYIVHEFNIDDIQPYRTQLEMNNRYFININFQICIDTVNGTNNGPCGSWSDPFKSPVCANSAAQYWSELGYKITLNFKPGLDLTDYNVSFNGLRNVTIYPRDLTFAGLHMFNCHDIEINGNITLNDVGRLSFSKTATLDIFECYGVKFNGVTTILTSQDTQSFRSTHSFDITFNTLSMNSGYTVDFPFSVNVLEGPSALNGNYLTHTMPTKSYTSADVKSLISDVLTEVGDVEGNYVGQIRWTLHWVGLFTCTVVSGTRKVGMIIPQIQNAGNKIYVFAYEGGTVYADEIAGTAI